MMSPLPDNEHQEHISVTSNFGEDIRQQLLDALIAFGCSVNNADNVDAVAQQYYNVKHRLIPPTPRKVLWSEVLLHRIAEGEIPSPRLEVVQEIARLSEDGCDLTPFLHDKILDATFDNPLLNDWMIYHLHLGSKSPGNKRFVARSDELLFVYCTKEDLYFIDVRSHSGGVWADPELVEILDDNWPQLLAHRRSPARLRPGAKLEISDRMRGRARGVVHHIVLKDGRVFMPLGESYMSDGFSAAALDEADELLNGIGPVEKWCRENGQWLHDEILRQTGMDIRSLRIRASLEEVEHHVVEDETGARIPVSRIHKAMEQSPEEESTSGSQSE